MVVAVFLWILEYFSLSILRSYRNVNDLKNVWNGLFFAFMVMMRNSVCKHCCIWILSVPNKRSKEKKYYRNRIADYVFKYIDYLVFLQAMLTRYTFTAVVDSLLLFFLPSGLELTLIDFGFLFFIFHTHKKARE